MKKLSMSAALGAMFCAAAGVFAQPVINVGTHQLQPNQAGQSVSISVSGGELVRGINFFVMSGDGGEALGGAANSAPVITGVSVSVGTIFGSFSQTLLDQTPQFWSATLDTNGTDIAASGVVATLTIDTTGFASGSYPLLVGSFNPDLGIPDTTFSDSSAGGEKLATIYNGTLDIAAIPEPASLSLLALASIPMLRRRR